MPRKFKVEFSSVGKANFVLLENLYKRRPRAHLKHLSAADLFDLASLVVSPQDAAQRSYLPTECTDYLRLLESYDAYRTFPNLIDPTHWQQFVNFRRQKIALELRMRSKQAEMGAAETYVNRILDRIVDCRSHVETLKTKLRTLRSDRLLTEINNEIQLVLKMGQVEIRMRGDSVDAARALFVPRSEVEAVNALIHEAGEAKLAAMCRALQSRRRNLSREWRHLCLSRRQQDLREELHNTCNVTVTREMQELLKCRARGLREEKTVLEVERGLRQSRERCLRLVAQQSARLAELRREIGATSRRNAALDRRIARMNAARCAMEQRRDLIGEELQRSHGKRAIRMLAARSDLIGRLQDNYAELLALKTEHELLRLRRYPILAFGTPDKSNLP